MFLRRRMITIYKKELTEVLRDRRTLIAMIVVPIALYPLLMLGSIQAVTTQGASLEVEDFIIGVISERDQRYVGWQIMRDTEFLERQQNGSSEKELKQFPKPLKNWKVSQFLSEKRLRQAIQDRVIQVGVVIEEVAPLDDPSRQSRIVLFSDREEIRSVTAMQRLRSMFVRMEERTRDERLRLKGLPETFVTPFEISSVNLAAPSSVLGQILPLILILMTITGAIYPAIDLTAGERERNTLESLMVTPVPVLDIIVGKFLVVTTVAIMGATLNLGSVTATVWFGGFNEIIADEGGGVPIGKMGVILLCLIPFAVLMSAIMIAVSSYARTFKEAQNYVTPVILAVLIPGGIAALPTTRLEGVMLVVPVGNMVLFAKEMLLGVPIPWWQTATVLLSTTLYASAAVAVAATVFGQESVVFADAASWKSTLSRKFIKPTKRPAVSLALLLVALLFPVWFFVQTAMQPGPDEDAAAVLRGTSTWMPLLFVVLPYLILLYAKVDRKESFQLGSPPLGGMLAALLIGVSSWVIAHEFSVLQSMVIAVPEELKGSNERLVEALRALPIWQVLIVLAVVPAFCEELLFRGFLMSGLKGAAGKWTCIITSALVFGVFHFMFIKLPVTAFLGVVLGYICWQSRSIWPSMLTHFLHNGLLAMIAIHPKLLAVVGVDVEAEATHLPIYIIVVGVMVFALGITIAILLKRSKASALRHGLIPST